MNVFEYFQQSGLQPDAIHINNYIKEYGGSVIRTFRDEIFTDDTDVTMDTEETLVLYHPLCNGEFAEKVEINPNFIVSITYYKPKSKIVLAN